MKRSHGVRHEMAKAQEQLLAHVCATVLVTSLVTSRATLTLSFVCPSVLVTLLDPSVIVTMTAGLRLS